MTERVDRDEIEARLAELGYPVTRADAAAAFVDVEVRTDHGPTNLGELVSEAGSDSFDGPAELATEVHEALDRLEEE